MTDLSAIDRNYREIGDTTLEAVLPLLRAKGSPMVATAAATHAAAKPLSALWWGQTGFENQWATTGNVIQPEDHNPAALRPWVGDPTATKTGDVIDWKTRRKVGTIKVPSYALGAIRDSVGDLMLRYPDDASCAREWKRRMTDPAYKNGVYTGAKTLWEMLNIYCPPNDKPHPVTGVPNASILPTYFDTVTRLLTQFAAAEGDVPAGEPTNGGSTMAEHRYGIGMGHRNINYGGAWGESDWTPSCARALKEAIEARGGEAHLFQEHDQDNDPNFSTGKGLQAAARVGSDTIVNRYGPLTAIFFCHYNGGGGAGAHFIYPDGWVAPDRGVDNPLDIELSTAIKRNLAKTNTVGFLHWGGWLGPEPGVMSERNTGAVANRYGYRLGELVGTIQHRSTTPRLIIEAGSIDTSERKYITNPAWVRHVYCEAIVDALEEVFGAMPKPKPQQPPVESVYVTPIQRKWADEALAARRPFVDLPDKNHPAGRTRWWLVDRNYLTITAVERQQVATDTSKFLNEPIPAGTPIWVDFAGENYEDEPYGLTPWGTMVRMDTLRPIDWPNQPDLYAVNVNEVIDAVQDVLEGDDTAA